MLDYSYCYKCYYQNGGSTYRGALLWFFVKVYLLKFLVKTVAEETDYQIANNLNPLNCHCMKYSVSNHWKLFKVYVDQNRWVVKPIDDEYPS